MTQEQFAQHAAEHPEAVAPFVEQGKKIGAADARKELKALREVFGADLASAVDSFDVGETVDQAKTKANALAKAREEAAAQIKAKDAEIAALKAQVEKAQFEAGSQSAVKPGKSEDENPVAKAGEQYRAEMKKLTDGGMSKEQAAAKIARNMPDLQAAYVAEANQR